jgi:hypothetical protein
MEDPTHWPKLFEKLRYSTQDFYSAVERALGERQVPDLKFERVVFREGGMLSDNRDYLRISRERIIFDICGAPFGTGFFVSVRAGEKPLRLGLLAYLFIIVFLVGAVELLIGLRFGVYRYMAQHYSLSAGQTTWMLAGVLALLTIAMIIRVGGNFDVFLMGFPIVSFFYERFFRSKTYWRDDRMCMYTQAVNPAVQQVIEEITASQRILPMSELTSKPIHPDLTSKPHG